jgi:long-chain acyl-CoA synthetase
VPAVAGCFLDTKKVWGGREMNYCELLFDNDERYQSNEVLIDADNGRRLTYKELKGEVRRVAGLLRSKGYKPGTVIATHLYNSVEAAVALLAIQYIGGVICLIDPLFNLMSCVLHKEFGGKCLSLTLRKVILSLRQDLSLTC